MSLNVKQGDTAPGFSGLDQNGNQIKLSGFRGRHVVLFFYPEDGTPGCTNEAKNFQKNIGDLREMGAEVIGVSTDSVKSHKDFASKLHLDYPIVADEDKQIVRQYGVEKNGRALRTSVLLDRDGRVSRVFEAVNPQSHPNEIVNELRQRTKAD